MERSPIVVSGLEQCLVRLWQIERDFQCAVNLRHLWACERSQLRGQAILADRADLFAHRDRVHHQASCSGSERDMASVDFRFICCVRERDSHDYRTIPVNGVSADDDNRANTALFGSFRGLKVSPKNITALNRQ